MSLLVLGINHRSAPLAWRERVAFSDTAARAALPALVGRPGVSEAALVNTCNRTELITRADQGVEVQLVQWLHEHQDLTAGSLDEFLYIHRDGDAVRHLFKVASGLDSMVLGETQILGQLKNSWRLAQEQRTLGTALERLFQQAFSVAKRVRTETAIGRHPVSVAYCAVRLAQDAFTDLSKATVLLIGAGETVELALRHLQQIGVGRVLIANRTTGKSWHNVAFVHGRLVPVTGPVALPLVIISGFLTVGLGWLIGFWWMRRAMKKATSKAAEVLRWIQEQPSRPA